MLTIFLQKKIYLVKVEIWSDKDFVRQTLGEDLLRQGYVRKTDESLTNRLVVLPHRDDRIGDRFEPLE